MKSRMVIYLALSSIIVLSQSGCTLINEEAASGGGILVQQVKSVSESGQDKQAVPESLESRQAAVLDAFDALAAKGAVLAETIAFLDSNIPLASQENASKMVLYLEEVQKRELSNLSMKYNTGSAIQYKLMKEFKSGFNMSQIDSIQDKELKDLLLETRNSGYKTDMTEGYYFPVIDYGFYKKYSSYVSPDIKDYLGIMAAESDKAPAKDAALVISREEMIKRALSQEKFMNSYRNSIKYEDVKKLFNRYVYFTFYGLDNSPLFDRVSRQFIPDVRTVYSSSVKNSEGSKYLKSIIDFLSVLDKNNNKLTDEVDNFRKNAVEEFKK